MSSIWPDVYVMQKHMYYNEYKFIVIQSFLNNYVYFVIIIVNFISIHIPAIEKGSNRVGIITLV